MGEKTFPFRNADAGSVLLCLSSLTRADLDSHPRTRTRTPLHFVGTGHVTCLRQAFEVEGFLQKSLWFVEVNSLQEERGGGGAQMRELRY